MAPPPPVTPSPHRFVIKKAAPVRRPVPPPPPSSQLHQTPRPSQQFNATPRFQFSSTPKPPPTPSQSLPRITPSASRYLTPAPKQQHDVIDELSDDLPGDIHESIETDDHELLYDNEFSDDGDDYRLEEPKSKRRRLSVSSIISQDEDVVDHHDQPLEPQQLQHSIENNQPEPLSSLPILSSPPLPPSKRQSTTTAPKFLPPTPAPPSPSLPSTTTFLKPPRFRPPDPEQVAQHTDPLPDQFSPHRKGQKYVPGGLASEVQSWLINLESSIPIPVHTTNSNHSSKSQWLVRILVDEITGHAKTGFCMVKGRQIHTIVNGDGEEKGMVDTIGEVRVLLAGEGQMVGLQKGAKVEVGSKVGIKGPVWEVMVEGERWGVGVDWKVL